jgi:hypothetical protein
MARSYPFVVAGANAIKEGAARATVSPSGRAFSIKDRCARKFSLE